MFGKLKARAKETIVYDFVRYIELEWAVSLWRFGGGQMCTPHRIKQDVVKKYATEFALRILIETGTYLGDMIRATKSAFDEIYSIELNTSFCERVRKRFAACPHIHIVEGDSADVLPRILATISRPCLFWLDAHYSGGLSARGRLETPIVTEIECILNHPIPDHVLLVDDARLFNGEHGYPTLGELREGVKQIRPTLVVEVADDIVRIHPHRTTRVDEASR